MIDLPEVDSTQILLLANDLLGESLAKQLGQAKTELKVCLKPEDLSRRPSLVIWSIENLEMPASIQFEIQQLQEHWQPSPLLLIIPLSNRLSSKDLLQFDSAGLLQDPDLTTLLESINTLLEGGRVVRLKDENQNKNKQTMPIGVGQWLLMSGIQQVNMDLRSLEIALASENNLLIELLIRGKKRELVSAKNLLFWLWGSPKGFVDENNFKEKSYLPIIGLGAKDNQTENEIGTSISIAKRNSLEVWNTINGRLNNAIEGGLINKTGNLLAIEGLNPLKQQSLLLALVSQFDLVMEKLRKSQGESSQLDSIWLTLQEELQQQALAKMAGSYVRLPLKGEPISVIEHLIVKTDLSNLDDDLPNMKIILEPLILDHPLMVEGQLLPAENPRALIEIEMHISNWLIRTAEIISAEVLEVCGEWPELRRYMLKQKLISTRELERLRNQLNSQNRWKEIIQKPVQLYESKRLFYKLNKGSIESHLITEPRDEELKQLGWLQQQVALIVETRDALAPQIQTLIKKLGDLLVVLLTQVIGRAIGLIGRGIAQGMGRSLGRN